MIGANGRTELQQLKKTLPIYTVGDGLPLVRGESNIWFYGRLDYEDVFGGGQTHRWLMRFIRVRTDWRLQSYDYRHYNSST
jgi:hypothetical protein